MPIILQDPLLSDRRILADHDRAEARVLDEHHDVGRVDHNGELVPATTGGALCDREPIPAELQPLAEVARTVTPNSSLVDVINKVREAFTCPKCGKSLAVMNIAVFSRRRGTILERISLERHCSCPGGPAHHLLEEKAS